MATTWHDIPFCIDLLRAIAPDRLLDVSADSGRWGVILREFCDDRRGARARLEGIAASGSGLDAARRGLYDAVHEGRPAEVLESQTGRWDAVMVGSGILRGGGRDAGRALLGAALDRADYVVAQVMLGDGDGPADGSGSWEPRDFESLSCVRHALFADHDGNAVGVFCLSKSDPKHVRASLGTPAHSRESAPPAPRLPDEDTVVRRVCEMADELAYIKAHSTYRVGARLRRNGWWNRLRWLRNRNQRIVTVRALGRPGAGSQGTEVWLLEGRANAGLAPVPWDFIESDGGFAARAAADRAYGRCLVCAGTGTARVPVDTDPELVFLSHGWSGLVEVEFMGRRETIDLSVSGTGADSGTVTVRPAQNPMRQAAVARPVAPEAPAAPVSTASRTKLRMFSAREQQYIESVRAASPRVLAVSCPRWLGVTSSTRGLFEHWYPVPATREEDPYNIPADQIEHHAAVIAATGVEHVVVSGGDTAQLRLVEAVRRLRPSARFDLFWHASYVQFSEDYTWQLFGMWVDAARRGVIHSIATDKFGQDRLFRSLGVRSAVLLNRVDGECVEPATDLPPNERHVGMWLSGFTSRKNPHAALSALKLVPEVRLHATGVDERARAVIEYLGIPCVRMQSDQLTHDELFPAMRRTHCTMYVTFAECCPMLPLESLRMGVPCLIGPVSHLFEDNRYLYERLVVPFPERADVIAEYLVRAIDERVEIAAEYRRYLPTYEARCRRSVEDFLNLGSGPATSGATGDGPAGHARANGDGVTVTPGRRLSAPVAS
ncbi:MAG: hypothetical protein KF745_08590 [Phycisphaeraceae bacterium]|nr:hypothetical protein [Phycisphaeraceae bacterium]